MAFWLDVWGLLWSPYQLNPTNRNPLGDLLRERIPFDELRRGPDGIKLFVCATDVETNKMTYENAMRWYHWDPFTHIPKDQATVGALRRAAEGHDVSIQALSHHKEGERGSHTRSALADGLSKALLRLGILRLNTSKFTDRQRNKILNNLARVAL